MIKIEKTDVYGWEAAVRGMRNPMNSWAKSDSGPCVDKCINPTGDGECAVADCMDYTIGTNDLALMRKLAKGGSVHAKYRRMITVTCDITAPLYWWKEFDTYKVGTVANSCSTMHKIHAKEFTLDDFSREHLDGTRVCATRTFETFSAWDVLALTIDALNYQRQHYLETNDKHYWWQMIQLLPTSYNQRRTVQLNYEVLVGMYRDRKAHKLDEWRELCTWVRTLPYSELITGEEVET